MNQFGLVAVGFVEALLVGWVLKTGYFREMANANSYFRLGKWWEICIKIVPVVLGATMGWTIYDLIVKGYGGYPAFSLVIYGVLVVAVCFAFSFLLQKKPWPVQKDIAEAKRPPSRLEK